MRLVRLLVVVTTAAALGLAQQRVKPQGAADFTTLHGQILESWKSESYGRCLSQTRELMGIVSRKRAQAVLAALPPAPGGYEIVPPSPDDQQTNAMMAAVTASVGSVVEQTYRPTAGGEDVMVKVTSDSPMLSMLSMWLTNPAMLGPDAELIEYTGCKGVLHKEGSGVSLQVVIGHDLVEAEAPGRDGDFLLALLNQAAIDRLVATLAR